MGAGVHRTEGTNDLGVVFSTETDKSILKSEDFLKLMVAQMQNQDFTNPMDDSSFVTQMAAFSNMQQMQEMAAYSKTNYAMGLVGQTVTASRYTVSGGLDTTTGKVDKISLVDDEYVLYIGDKKYLLSQIMEVGTVEKTEETTKPIDPTGYDITAGHVDGNSAMISWEVPTLDEKQAEGLTYTLYYVPYGSTNTMDSVEKVKAGHQVGMQNLADTSRMITGLSPSSNYRVNVVVKDADGKEYVYKPIEFKTSTGSGSATDKPETDDGAESA